MATKEELQSQMEHLEREEVEINAEIGYLNQYEDTGDSTKSEELMHMLRRLRSRINQRIRKWHEDADKLVLALREHEKNMPLA